MSKLFTLSLICVLSHRLGFAAAAHRIIRRVINFGSENSAFCTVRATHYFDQCDLLLPNLPYFSRKAEESDFYVKYPTFKRLASSSDSK